MRCLPPIEKKKENSKKLLISKLVLKITISTKTNVSKEQSSFHSLSDPDSRFVSQLMLFIPNNAKKTTLISLLQILYLKKQIQMIKKENNLKNGVDITKFYSSLNQLSVNYPNQEENSSLNGVNSLLSLKEVNKSKQKSMNNQPLLNSNLKKFYAQLSLLVMLK